MKDAMEPWPVGPGSDWLSQLQTARQLAEQWDSSERNGGTGDDDWINAVKHCIWSCEMTQREGVGLAKDWGTAHECDKNGVQQNQSSDTHKRDSSNMDLNNNRVGREIGAGSPQGNCNLMCQAEAHNPKHGMYWIKGDGPPD